MKQKTHAKWASLHTENFFDLMRKYWVVTTWYCLFRMTTSIVYMVLKEFKLVDKTYLFRTVWTYFNYWNNSILFLIMIVFWPLILKCIINLANEGISWSKVSRCQLAIATVLTCPVWAGASLVLLYFKFYLTVVAFMLSVIGCLLFMMSVAGQLTLKEFKSINLRAQEIKNFFYLTQKKENFSKQLLH